MPQVRRALVALSAAAAGYLLAGACRIAAPLRGSPAATALFMSTRLHPLLIPGAAALAGAAGLAG